MLLSDPASRRQPLHLTRPSPPSGWPEDLHLQTAEHAQHTTKPRCGIRPALRWSAFHPSVSLAAKPYDLRCLRVSASSSISRTPRDPDPDGTVGVSPCQGDCGRRLRAASEKRGAPIALPNPRVEFTARFHHFRGLQLHLFSPAFSAAKLTKPLSVTRSSTFFSASFQLFTDPQAVTPAAPMLYVEMETILVRTPPKPSGPSGFDAFLRIAERGTPFTALGGRAFITVPAQFSSGYLTLPIRSRAFRQRFFDQCFAECDTIPTTHAFNAIIHHLEAQAASDPQRCHIGVPYRVDSRGPFPTPEKILLDLANPEGQFVEITPEGWTVTSREGVPFETSSSTRPLPAPEQPNPQTSDSPLETLRSALNLGAPSSPDWLRSLAWLLAALRTHGPYPILILRGPSGCGKSLAARILRSIIDPSAAPFTPLPSSARELLTLARLNWVLAFDHVSALTPQIADTLCRLSTGVGVALRESGQPEPLQLYLKRPIILTVTDRWTPPPDLAARAFTVTLPPLTEDTRRPDRKSTR